MEEGLMPAGVVEALERLLPGVNVEVVEQVLLEHRPPAGALRREALRHRLKGVLDHLGVDAPVRLIEAWFEQADHVRAGVSPVNPDPPPWQEPVSGGLLLGEIESLLRAYVVLPLSAMTAVVAWVLASWVMDAFATSPVLAVLSP